jgi:hypothetical protein
MTGSFCSFNQTDVGFRNRQKEQKGESMMSMPKKIVWLGALFALLLAGCGQTEKSETGLSGDAGNDPKTPSETKAEEQKHDPVKISVGIKGSGYFTEEEFQKYITDPVQRPDFREMHEQPAFNRQDPAKFDILYYYTKKIYRPSFLGCRFHFKTIRPCLADSLHYNKP